MMNAQNELIQHIENRKVKYVRIIRNISYDNQETIEGALDEVLLRLNFDYDSGYGSQELEGTIWYSDGTWSDRGEYDGSEWWQYREYPSLPKIKPQDENIEMTTATTEDAIVNLIRSRGKVGRAKYNQTMDRTNLRPEQLIQHLQKKLNNTLQYAERIKNCGRLLNDARDIMLTLLHERDWECAAEWVARHDAQFFPKNHNKIN